MIPMHPSVLTPAINPHLENHLVWLVALPQAESRAQVRGEELLLLDGGDQALVDGLLVLGAARCQLLLLWLLTLLEESLFALLLLSLVSTPVGGFGDLVEDLALHEDVRNLSN